MKKELVPTRLNNSVLGYSIDILSSAGSWVTMYQLKSMNKNDAIAEASALIELWNANGGRYNINGIK